MGAVLRALVRVSFQPKIGEFQMMNRNMHDFTVGAAINENGLRHIRQNILNDETLRRMVPSAFAVRPFHGMSDRYAFVPTSKVIAALRSEGFEPIQATQSCARTEGKQNFTKHMIKFTRTDAKQITKVGDSIAQVCLVNSHDGSSVYSLLAGLWRLACSNGLLVSEGNYNSVSVRHSGDIVGEIIDGSYKVIESATQAGERAAEWKAITLDKNEALTFADAALKLRWDGSDDHTAPITADRLLVPRRNEDTGQDLWTAFNRVQESLVKGGNRGRTAKGRRHTTRPVQAIGDNVKLNRALWTLTEQMAKLKQAA
jgi:Domain of unknown function (DUF932)